MVGRAPETAPRHSGRALPTEVRERYDPASPATDASGPSRPLVIQRFTWTAGKRRAGIALGGAAAAVGAGLLAAGTAPVWGGALLGAGILGGLASYFTRPRQNQAQAPAAPQMVQQGGAGDHERQTWTHPITGNHRFVISSGHGYRPQHRVGGPDITQLAPRDEIETAILHHLAPDVQNGNIAVDTGGERQVLVAGQTVHYRYRRYSPDRTGVGTYFLP